MKKFIIYLFIVVIFISTGYKWTFLGKLPKNTWEDIKVSEDRQIFINLFIDSIKNDIPKCKRVYIDYETNDDDNYVDIYYMCFEWES